MRSHESIFGPHDLQQVYYKFVRLRSKLLAIHFIYGIFFENVFLAKNTPRTLGVKIKTMTLLGQVLWSFTSNYEY